MLPTHYAAQAVGGLIFGVGFVMSGWCPGTGAVGLASGKLDAAVFFVGVVLGAIVFNETYSWTAGLRDEGTVSRAFGLPQNTFALLFTLAAVGAFYFAEWIERRVGGGGRYLHSRFLRNFSAVLVLVAVIVFLLPDGSGAGGFASASSEQALLESVEAAEDHVEPEDLADAMVAAEPGLVVIDIRPADEYAAFHLRGAVNVPMADLIGFAAAHKNQGRIVLYSNGMTHPAQARDTLARLGYHNVFLLTDGLRGFVDRCLTPVSLRTEPLDERAVNRVRAWRTFFLAEPTRMDTST